MIAEREAAVPLHGRVTSILVWVATAAALVMVIVKPSHAQQVVTQPAPQAVAPPPVFGQNLEIIFTPYFWIPWVSSTIRPSDTRIPSVSATADPGTFISHLTWIPFLGAAEFRDGPYGLVLDYLHVPVKAGVNTPVLFAGVTTGLTEDAGTAMFLYRPIVQPEQYVDVGIGVRAWGLDGNIALNEGLLPAVTVANGLSWADPLIGVRYHRDLGNGFSATAYGDVGGFGVGAHIDWQVLGTIDYALNSWVELRGGFRSLNYSFGGDRANFTQHIYGPILGATFRF